MIRVHTIAPKAKLAYYGHLLFGPFSSDGSSLYEVTSVRSGHDDLKERPGIYGENHVNHRELHADVYEDVMRGYTVDDIRKTPMTWMSTSGDHIGSSEELSYMLNASYDPIDQSSKQINWSNRWTRIKQSPSRFNGVTLNGLSYSGLQVTYDGASITEETFRFLPGGALVMLTRTVYIPRGNVYVEYGNIQGLHTLLRDALSKGMSLLADDSATVYESEIPLEIRVPSLVLTRPHMSLMPVLSAVESARSVQLELPEDIKSHGDIATDAISTLDSNSINMLEFFQGLKRPQDLIPKLKNLSQLKTHAGNYLGLQYGILPTISDLATLKDALLSSARPYFDKNHFQVLTAGDSADRVSSNGSVKITNRVKICINPTDPTLESLSEKLRNVGGFPSVNNLWDLVPYSFVIDWFINIGDMLEAFDTNYRMSTLPIMYATTSSKIEAKPDISKTLRTAGFSGSVRIVYYDRSVSTSPPRPTLNFEVSNTLPNHWLEAGALIITHRK